MSVRPMEECRKLLALLRLGQAAVVQDVQPLVDVVGDETLRRVGGKGRRRRQGQQRRQHQQGAAGNHRQARGGAHRRSVCGFDRVASGLWRSHGKFSVKIRSRAGPYGLAAVADFMLPKLAVKAAQGGIIIDRIALDTLKPSGSSGSEGPAGWRIPPRLPPTQICCLKWTKLVGSQHCSGHQPGGIAGVGRPEKGQHQIGPLVGAPHRKGLAVILAMVGHVEPGGGGVEKAPQPQGGVNQETPPPSGRPGPLPPAVHPRQKSRAGSGFPGNNGRCGGRPPARWRYSGVTVGTRNVRSIMLLKARTWRLLAS